MFRDRSHAGQLLAEALSHYKGWRVLVLAIPRGGVELGYEVARQLKADFSLIVVRKLPLPHNPEAGWGAIAEDGSKFIFKEAVKWLSKEDRDRIIAYQEEEVKRRVRVLRQGRPLPRIKGRTVILVDDGLAMGATMIAAVRACRNLGAKRIIAAVPVGSIDVVKKIKRMVDELIVLETPDPFFAVAQAYERWSDVTDAEAISFMKKKI